MIVLTVTYSQIATQSPTTSPNEITFSSIPGTYTDLVIVATINASSNNDLWVRCNGDASALYSYTYLSGNGTSAFSGRATGQSAGLILDYYAAPNNDNNHVCIAHIFNYANTTTNKTAIARANRAAAGVDAVVSLWRSTAAITSLTFRLGTSGAQTFSTGSVISLYGIKAE